MRSVRLAPQFAQITPASRSEALLLKQILEDVTARFIVDEIATQAFQRAAAHKWDLSRELRRVTTGGKVLWSEYYNPQDGSGIDRQSIGVLMTQVPAAEAPGVEGRDPDIEVVVPKNAKIALIVAIFGNADSALPMAMACYWVDKKGVLFDRCELRQGPLSLDQIDLFAIPAFLGLEMILIRTTEARPIEEDGVGYLTVKMNPQWGS